MENTVKAHRDARISVPVRVKSTVWTALKTPCFRCDLSGASAINCCYPALISF